MAKFLVQIKQEKCKGCELCLTVCPKKLIVIGDQVNNKGYCPAKVQRQEECIGCGSCAMICPDCAIEIFAEED